MSWTCAAVCASLSLFCTSCRATVELSAACRACSDTCTCVRASSSWPARASVNMRSDASQNCLNATASTSRCADVLLPLHGVVEVGPDAIELRRPGGQRIAGLSIEHVAHGQPELVEVVLN